MKRKPTLLEAFFPIVMMLLLLAIGYGVYGFSPEPLLILASLFAGIIALRVGVNWDGMMEGIREKIDTAMPAILILISIGILIGTWMISGTIPMMIYYGLEIINPTFIVVIAFIVSAIISIVTGTSWGSVGTVGVALMGIATGLGASLPATAGAVVAGAYFGDKLSPLSDTTNLAPIAAGSELYEHIKHMLYTTVPAAIISLIVYTIAGFNLTTDSVSTPEEMEVMLQTLTEMFDWSVWLLLPPIIILYGSIRKKPTLPTIILSSIVAAVLAKWIQGFSAVDIFASTVTGFDVSMVSKAGFNPEGVAWEVTRLVNQGGMQSMTGVILIAFSAFIFAGIITKAGALEVIIEALLKIVKRTGDLILSTVLSCITMALVTGNSYLSIIVPGEIYKDTYQKKNLHAKNLSRTLEDSGTVVVPLIPWSSAGVYMAGTLGVSTLSYAPWAILCYVGFIIAIILGYTGIGIERISEEEPVNLEENKAVENSKVE
ncbi:Na+/H+ antiporter NhaC [Virgibacillus halodenitrificans]|uniref:Na+/H+ antiporter NhaC n=1 Tax=Virgibacillus halodenitrificans TaxID=1482 RepID=UPI001370CF04|nr:Na+/H+ antiporter NhaC [Virgibacillus halodenitrificans]MYL47282.1 Na+/H+ antiporter NhaC [Virgibacillus halodenitrificans]MYL59572.1 Na+/H+ antiporter NhaC [Virgibacillus halodenitrificans]